MDTPSGLPITPLPAQLTENPERWEVSPGYFIDSTSKTARVYKAMQMGYKGWGELLPVTGLGKLDINHAQYELFNQAGLSSSDITTWPEPTVGSTPTLEPAEPIVQPVVTEPPRVNSTPVVDNQSPALPVPEVVKPPSIGGGSLKVGSLAAKLFPGTAATTVSIPADELPVEGPEKSTTVPSGFNPFMLEGLRLQLVVREDGSTPTLLTKKKRSLLGRSRGMRGLLLARSIKL